MSSQTQPKYLAPSLEDLYARVERALSDKNVAPDVERQELFADLYRKVVRALNSIDRTQQHPRPLSSWFLPFDPAPWKTQLESLASLVTSVRMALLARLLVPKQNPGFRPLTQALPMQGFFESRVNKRNAP